MAIPHSITYGMAQRLAMWFVLPLLAMVAAQLLRMQQNEPALWLLCDYAGRLGVIAVLAAIPAARAVAFARVPSRMDAGLVAIWIIVVALIEIFGVRAMEVLLVHLFPAPWRLDAYPHVAGALRWFDLTAGLVLVAYSEELLFRRMAWAILTPLLGDGWRLAAISALLFGLFHWPAGLWHMAAAAVAGLILMRMYQRSGALWPVVAAHYVLDFIAFV